MFFIRGRRIAPPAVLTDRVVPVHYWDHHTKDAVINFMLRFDYKLDPSKLKCSLEKLLDRGDGWRKLGARTSGKLEYHVPIIYTKERPAISYHCTPYSISITQHPIASRLPSALSTSTVTSPQIVGRGNDFVSLMRRPGDPTCFEDYLFTDRPMLGLHIVSFSDATLVSLCSSHILFDAMGRKELFNAWSLTLQDREDEVLPLIEHDPLATLGTQEKATNTTLTATPESYKHASKQLRLPQLMTLGLRQVLDKILHSKAKKESRIICVPATFVDSLRQGALLVIQSGEDDKVVKMEAAKVFLSDGDVLCAWWTRQIVSSRIPNASKSSQTVAIMNMLGLRHLLLQKGLLPKHTSALVTNAMVAIPAFISAKNIVTRPLGRTAGVLRKAIQKLGTMAQVNALLGLQRAANNKKGGLPALFGDAGMHMVVCTNWTKAKFYEVDFSAAITTDYDQEKAHGRLQKKTTWTGTDREDRILEQEILVQVRVAKPTSIQMHLNSPSTPAFLMSIFTILGRDEFGNYWIMGTLRKRYWAKIEQALTQQSCDDKKSACG